MSIWILSKLKACLGSCLWAWQGEPLHLEAQKPKTVWTVKSIQGTKWHTINPNHVSHWFHHSQSSNRVLTESPLRTLADLPFAGAISAAARRNGCSEQVLEQFSTQKVQQSENFDLENWGKTCENLQDPIRKLISLSSFRNVAQKNPRTCLLRLSW